MPFTDPRLSKMAEEILADRWNTVDNWRADNGFSNSEGTATRAQLINGDYLTLAEFEEHLPAKEVPTPTQREIQRKTINYKDERAKAARGGPADTRLWN